MSECRVAACNARITYSIVGTNDGVFHDRRVYTCNDHLTDTVTVMTEIYTLVTVRQLTVRSYERALAEQEAEAAKTERLRLLVLERFPYLADFTD